VRKPSMWDLVRTRFDRVCREFGIDPEQSEGYCWKDKSAGIAWYFWYAGWRYRGRIEGKRKQASVKSDAAP